MEIKNDGVWLMIFDWKDVEKILMVTVFDQAVRQVTPQIKLFKLLNNNFQNVLFQNKMAATKHPVHSSRFHFTFSHYWFFNNDIVKIGLE